MGNKKVQTNVGGDDIAAKLASVPLASVTNLKLLFSISFIGLSKKNVEMCSWDLLSIL